MRALERLRAIETSIAERAEILRRWLRADLERAAEAAGAPRALPEPGRAERAELWWRDPRPGGTPRGDRETLDRIEVIAEWLAAADAVLRRRYEPGTGDGMPLAPLLGAILADLEAAARLRSRAGIRP
jgi:hypothetical protein